MRCACDALQALHVPAVASTSRFDRSRWLLSPRVNNGVGAGQKRVAQRDRLLCFLRALAILLMQSTHSSCSGTSSLKRWAAAPEQAHVSLGSCALPGGCYA